MENIILSARADNENQYEERREYVLSELRCAVGRTRLQMLDLEAIGLALRYRIIGPEAALRLAHEAGALPYLQIEGEVVS